MGNQPSKEKDGKGTGTPGSQTPTGSGPSLDSYPSFSKSDTKESARSLRTALRTKIPGSGKSAESPRSSSTALTSVTSPSDDRAETQSIRSAASGKAGQKQARASSGSTPGPLSPEERRNILGDDEEDIQPPPSPTQGPMTGEHQGIEEAQRSGEVDAVSDAPPTGNIRQAHNIS